MINLFAILLLANLSAETQCEGALYGRVVDARNQLPLAKVRIEVGDKVKPVRTNEKGEYRVNGLCVGQASLSGVLSEYERRVVKVKVDGVSEVNFTLSPLRVMKGEEIRVEAPRLKASDTRSVVSLEGDDLFRTRGESLADALANLPGVSVLRNGATTKPIVRGQYGTRVLKLFDGVRHEGQDWGLDHGPEIDSFATGSMSVVKGSAGVRYGPDAIAGVLLIEPPDLLTEPGIAIHTQSVGAFNGRQTTAGARVDGNHRWLPGASWRVDVNYSRGAGLMSPEYPLDNTGHSERNYGGVFQYANDILTAKLSYRKNSKKNGVCLCVRNESTSDFESILRRGKPVNSDLYKADYEIERPYQSVIHETSIARIRLNDIGIGALELTYAFQVNDRVEFDIIRIESSRPQYIFLLKSHTFDLIFERQPISLGKYGRLEGMLGLSGMGQENIYQGLPLLSDYRSVSGGVFAIERLVLGSVEFEAGARYDHEAREADIPKKTYQSLVREERISEAECTVQDNSSRCGSTFHAGTLSLGALYRMTKGTTAKLDLSSATRMPTIDEQYINGTSPSFPIMARGLASLGPETSWSLSSTFETSQSWVSAEASFYGNFIKDYIYLSPELREDGTVRTDVLINGRFPRFAYTAIDAVYYGADANAKFRMGDFDLGIQGSVVRAYEADTGEFLLFIPSDRVRGELTYHLPRFGVITDPQISVNSQYVARQYNVSPAADFAPVPDGYHLLGAQVSTALTLNRQRYTLDLEVQNVLNTEYRDYTSMLRYYAAEAGFQAFVRFGTELNL